VGKSESWTVRKSERQIVGKSDWLKSQNGLTVGKLDSWKVRLVEKSEWFDSWKGWMVRKSERWKVGKSDSRKDR